MDLFASLEIELMLLGFISLLLTAGQSRISKICVPQSVANSWQPCKREEEAAATGTDGDDDSEDIHGTTGRRLLYTESCTIVRRILAGGGTDECAAKVIKLFIPVFLNAHHFLSLVHIYDL